ncbi:MAG TPA: glycosyltransferase, partial [Patescibacteria group bacterium]|nr:glycosyltransferase [Patescibacteria group bacterium]
MRVMFTGGGTLGHVLPNLAVIEEISRHSRKNEIMYVGSRGGLEREALEKFIERHGYKHILVREIVCGKLRRYFSFRNFVDFFKVPIGVIQSFFIVLKFRPEVLFSKGGFVAVPVVIGARIARLFGGRAAGGGTVRIFIHESDVVPGLANRICARFADKIFVSFNESVKFFGKRAAGKVVVVGNPVRREIFDGSREAGLKMCGFNRFKSVILAMGGSQGALQINNLVWNNLDEILKKYQVVHIVGKGNLNFGV